MKKITSGRNLLPDWFRQDIPDAGILAKFRSLKDKGINTVCLEAKCPNWSRCLSANTLAFMILGNYCTRSCRFCAVGRKPQDKPLSLDKQEAYRILEVVRDFRLRFVIITSVSRDDLDDRGAGQFAETLNLIRNYKRDIGIEVIIPDFYGWRLKKVVKACPDVLAHNVETVPRLYPRIRPDARYARSLKVLRESKQFNPNLITKSSLLLGLSEKEAEVIRVMDDLRKAACDILVLGQYLAPSSRHYPVKEYIGSRQFKRYRRIGLGMGFKAVSASGLARTSYRAEELYKSIKRCAN